MAKNKTIKTLVAYGWDGEVLEAPRLRYCPGQPGGPVWTIENIPEGASSIDSDTNLLGDMVDIEIDHALPLEDLELPVQKSGKELFLDGVAQALNVVETLGPSREVSLMKTKLEEAVLWAGAYEAAMLADCGCETCSPPADPYGSEFHPEDFLGPMDGDLEDDFECDDDECWCQDDIDSAPLDELIAALNGSALTFEPENLWCSREAYMAGCDCDRCLAEDVRDEDEVDEHLCDEYCY